MGENSCGYLEVSRGFLGTNSNSGGRDGQSLAYHLVLIQMFKLAAEQMLNLSRKTIWQTRITVSSHASPQALYTGKVKGNCYGVRGREVAQGPLHGRYKDLSSWKRKERREGESKRKEEMRKEEREGGTEGGRKEKKEQKEKKPNH